MSFSRSDVGVMQQRISSLDFDSAPMPTSTLRV
jgi:hypothetical protein